MKTKKERQLAAGRGREGGGRGAKSYDRKKAWSSINHSIPSDTTVPVNLLINKLYPMDEAVLLIRYQVPYSGQW
jgi:hypothetical protein